MKIKERFRQFAIIVSTWTGTPIATMLAMGVIATWVAVGPSLRFSDSYMLVGNTYMSFVSYVMLFFIQASQNRDSRAIQAKLNAIIAAQEGASNKLIDLENQAEEELDKAVEEIKAYRKEDG